MSTTTSSLIATLVTVCLFSSITQSWATTTPQVPSQGRIQQKITLADTTHCEYMLSTIRDLDVYRQKQIAEVMELSDAINGMKTTLNVAAIATLAEQPRWSQFQRSLLLRALESPAVTETRQAAQTALALKPKEGTSAIDKTKSSALISGFVFSGLIGSLVGGITSSIYMYEDFFHHSLALLSTGVGIGVFSAGMYGIKIGVTAIENNERQTRLNDLQADRTARLYSRSVVKALQEVKNEWENAVELESDRAWNELLAEAERTAGSSLDFWREQERAVAQISELRDSIRGRIEQLGALMLSYQESGDQTSLNLVPIASEIASKKLNEEVVQLREFLKQLHARNAFFGADRMAFETQFIERTVLEFERLTQQSPVAERARILREFHLNEFDYNTLADQVVKMKRAHERMQASESHLNQLLDEHAQLKLLLRQKLEEILNSAPKETSL